MNDNAGFVDVGPARRLASAIDTIRVLLMILAGVGTLAGVANADGAFAAIVLIYGLVAVVSIYVTFGWLESTLRLLVGIAYNTAEAANLEPGGKD